MANGIKILLCEDVENLGWLGDIVEVNAGYARNFLIPQGLAQKATKDNIRALAQEKARRSEIRIQQQKRLVRAAEAVEGAEAVLAAKANEQGHLFGSIGAADIAGNLREQGFEVADEIVRLDDNIKEVGTSQVILKFAADLTATVNVVVVAEGEEQQAPDEADTEENAEEAPAEEEKS
jgi:large subunit ribosomal protein L9